MKQKTQSEVNVSESKNTSLPWTRLGRNIFGDNGQSNIAKTDGADQDEMNANAQLIITAVNSYDDMLEALKAIKARLNGEFDHPSLVAYGPLSDSETDDILGYAEEAIQKAQKITSHA
jgi:hypothetical protein